MSAYEKIEHKARKIGQLREVEAIAQWDEACMMPAGGGGGRSEALATLATLIHDELAHAELGALIERANGHLPDLDPWQLANLSNLQRAHVRATAVPSDLVHAERLATLRCEQTWRVARSENDWANVAPLLHEVVGLARQHADALADALGLSRYDALLDGYEPELRVADVELVFEDLKAFLPTAIDAVLDRQKEVQPLQGPFDLEAQRQLSEHTMRLLGFDFDRGRLDVSHHPFCGGVPDDTRITTRYREASFIESLMATCHETGHALYQQGLPRSWRQQPVGDALGAAVHESQSLLVELQVCRSRAFMELMAPTIRERFGRKENDPAWRSENLYRHVTRVNRGYIRVDADELTYPLHVILRFELERQLVDGQLPVADLPEAWNEAMQRYLGLSTAGNDADGCMQDVHWYAGLFGYFPTYTLGALMAAQWFAVARESLPDLNGDIARGQFARLLEWLRENVHAHGRKSTMQALLQEVTGSPLDARFYKRHVESRYLD